MVMLYLDDVRDCPYNFSDVIVVRTPEQFKEAVAKYIKDINLISLDHDLGSDTNETGYSLLKWLASNYDLANKDIVSHSANPVGKANIDNYVDFLRQHKRL